MTQTQTAPPPVLRKDYRPSDFLIDTVELFFEGRRVASHRRNYSRWGTAVTLEAHRPKNHRQYGSWPPERLIRWAETIGPNAAKVVSV